jgi:hypothetical protein
MRKKIGLLLPHLLIAIGQVVGQGTAKSPDAHGQTAARFNSATVRSVLAQKLPAEIKLPTGKLLEAKQWVDANGQNLLLVLRTPERTMPSKDMDEVRQAELHIRQYVRHNSIYLELWRLQDAVRECPVDLTLDPLPGATSITDLDNDGQTETTVLYRLACRGDVSPAQLKLIMREGKAKYALRGQMIQLLNYSSKETQRKMLTKPICCADNTKPTDANYEQLEGLYQNEKDFATAPPAFLTYARQQWRRWRAKDTFE